MELANVTRFLDDFAPQELAEDWDNVGLLAGDPAQSVRRVLTCLTYTWDVAQEAIEWEADLVVTHHPLPFRPIKRLTVEVPAQRVLWESARAGIAVYSPHTAFDSASEGINQQLAEGLQLTDIVPLQPHPDQPSVGGGRRGRFAEPLLGAQLVERVRQFLSVCGLHVVGDLEQTYSGLAVACGAAGGFLDGAIRAGCDAFLTGETNFHTALEARSRGALLLLPGHFATERFAVERLAQILQREFPELECRASQVEGDPLQWVAEAAR